MTGLKKIIWLVLVQLCVCSGSSAQVELKEKIMLTGEGQNNKQVTGLAYPDSSHSAVNASSVLSGALIYDAATGSDTLQLQLDPSPLGYKKGMLVHLKAPANNAGPLWISINDLGARALLKKVTQPIDSAEVLSGQMVSAIYDGNAFQVTSKLNRPCPYNFVDVNDDYCIQRYENPTIAFYTAMLNCGNKDAALCTWSEWYYACQKTTLGLVGMNDNFEWIGDASNYTTSQVNARVAGSPTCQNPASIVLSAGSNKPYRCCYRKK